MERKLSAWCEDEGGNQGRARIVNLLAGMARALHPQAHDTVPPSWIRIEPCVSLENLHFGACWRKSGLGPEQGYQ
jgi:hypothetical protein